MKRTMSLLSVAVILVAVALMSAHVIPRFGTTNSSNRTFSSVSLGYTVLSDTLGSTPDTVTIGGANYNENCFDRTYVLNLKDSCVLAWSSTASSWLGDRVTIIIENGSVSGNVKFLGYSLLATKWSMQGGTTTISPTASHPWIAHFTFDGSTYLMDYKSQD